MFEIPMSVIWLALTVIFAVVEAATLGLTAIWFAAGSLVAMVAALLHAPLWLQVVLFLLVAAVTLYFTRGLAKNYNVSRQKTNADRVIGMEGIVLQQIDNEHAAGQVRVNGQVWTARSVTQQIIVAGARVTIKAIEGVKVIVEPIE